jgi:nitric oxide reductase NorD protein
MLENGRWMRESRDSILREQEPGRFPPAIVSELRRVMPLVPRPIHQQLLTLTGKVLALSSPAASEFLRNCPFVTHRAGPDGLDRWCLEGLEILQQSEQSAITYFGLGMSRSTLLVQRLSPGVELDGISALLETYCLALTGRKSPVLSGSRPRGYGAGQSMPIETSGDGYAIFLPDFVDRYPVKPENFTWFKVMATHQAGHIEFGSRALYSDSTQTDLNGFLELIGDSRLAADIFTIVEDGRIDYLIKQQYRGIAGAYGRIQDEALSARPPLTVYRLKEAFLEVLVQMSLCRFGKWLVPTELCTPLRLAGSIMKRILSSCATVDDSINGTIHLYQIASGLSSEPVPGDEWQTVDLDDSPEGISLQSSEIIDKMLSDLTSTEPESSAYASPPEVEYRSGHRMDSDYGAGEPGPASQDGTGTDPSQPSRQASDETADIDDLLEVGSLAADKGSTEEELIVFGVNSANKENVPVVPQPELDSNDDNNDRPLTSDGPFSYLYNEWDFRASDYRLHWCRVRQIPLQEGTPDFFEAILSEYTELATLLRRQFELLNPQFTRKVKQLQDGEDFDLDAVVDFVITRKAGQNPDGKVYWQRNKTERDVSVAFLLDMSSSTIEYINKTQRGAINQPVFKDYKDYFEWLQPNQDSFIRPKDFKRIIDLEKESLVLLIRALEVIGDKYAIYGFSGYGRENVEFYVVKDLEEEFSNRVKSRIDTITPQHGTRMGPAIRHATWKLEQQESRSKFLFLISDGRPEDHGYGQNGLEKEYAINDTKMALVETKNKGITPFCLTIDRAGHDYLKTICGDMGYEVVADIESLPRCLPTLYRRFTT